MRGRAGAASSGGSGGVRRSTVAEPLLRCGGLQLTAVSATHTGAAAHGGGEQQRERRHGGTRDEQGGSRTAHASLLQAAHIGHGDCSALRPLPYLTDDAVAHYLRAIQTSLLPPACVTRTGCEPEMVGAAAGWSCATSRRCQVWQPGRQSSRRSERTRGRHMVRLTVFRERDRKCRVGA